MFPISALFVGAIFLFGINTGTVDAQPAVDIFYLFNQEYPDGVELTISNAASIVTSKAEIHVYMHGLYGSGNDTWIGQARTTLLNDTFDFHQIVVDYSTLAGTSYDTTFAGIPSIAEDVTDLLVELITNDGVDSSTITLVGYSFGAQLAGYVGQYVLRDTSVLVGTVVGLDPAGPSYEGEPNSARLDSSDGAFVQIIHTTSSEPNNKHFPPRGIGTMDIVADVDFMINAVSPDYDGCGVPTTVCNHYQAVVLYLESLSTDVCGPESFYAEEEVLRTTTQRICWWRFWCWNRRTTALVWEQRADVGIGFHADPTVTGEIRVLTGNSAPFCYQ